MNNIYKCRIYILYSVILRCLTAFLTTVLLAGGAASAGYAQEPVPDGIKGLRETWEKHKGGEEPETEAGPQYNTSKQTTEEDILRMNHGDATLLYSEEGYLTFLRGKYCEEKVLNPEDGIATLSPMATLLGLSRGSEFFAVFGQTNRFGYTYFTYQQRYGDITIENAVLKIIVDPEGYTAGLISSFTPNIGIAPENEQAISKEEAGEITRTFWAGENLHTLMTLAHTLWQLLHTGYLKRLERKHRHCTQICWAELLWEALRCESLSAEALEASVGARRMRFARE